MRPIRPSPLDRHSRGFSLVELMVVIFLIGLATSVVVLAMPGDSRSLTDDADHFAARVAAARDEAVLGARPVAVWVSAEGYGFERRAAQGWQPLPGTGFADGDWRAGTIAQVPVVPGNQDVGREEASRLRVSFDSSGLPSGPMAVVLLRGEQSATVRITATGTIERERE